MTQRSAFIVEDEPHSRELLRQLLLEYCPQVRVCGMASGVAEAAGGIQQCNPQLVFLDVMLNGQTGFELLEQLSPFSFRLIFTTSYDRYALQAFRYAAADYLLKPISIAELKTAVQKALPAALPPVKDHIALPLVNGFEVVRLPGILYCISTNTYTTFYLDGGQHIMVSRTLKECAGMLEPYGFLRIHQSHLINLTHLKKYIRGSGGQVMMADGRYLDVSPRKKDDLVALLNRL